MLTDLSSGRVVLFVLLHTNCNMTEVNDAGFAQLTQKCWAQISPEISNDLVINQFIFPINEPNIFRIGEWVLLWIPSLAWRIKLGIISHFKITCLRKRNHCYLGFYIAITAEKNEFSEIDIFSKPDTLHSVKTKNNVSILNWLYLIDEEHHNEYFYTL